MINGKQDDRIRLREVRPMVARIQQRIHSLQYMEIDSDHFFMLTKRKTCFDWINEFIGVPVSE